MTGVPSVAEVFTQANADGWDLDRLQVELVQREDTIALYLLTAGMNLGGDAAFVRKAILDIGIGTPPSDEEAQLINAAFAERMAYYQHLQQQQPPEEN